MSSNGCSKCYRPVDSSGNCTECDRLQAECKCDPVQPTQP